MSYVTRCKFDKTPKWTKNVMNAEREYAESVGVPCPFCFNIALAWGRPVVITQYDDGARDVELELFCNECSKNVTASLRAG